MRRSVPFCLAFFCLLAACNSPGPQAARPLVGRIVTPTPNPTQVAIAALPTSSPTTAPPPATIAWDMEKVKRQVAEVEAQASSLRGLKAKIDVPENFKSPEELGAYLAGETRKYYTPEQAKLDTTILWLLMFIDDPSLDLYQLEVEFGGEMVLGLYDHQTKELYVRNDREQLSPQARETLAHEFVHSLQDQYFDLQKLLPTGIDHDRNMAVRSIVEGDATISGLVYAYQNMSKSELQQAFSSGESSAPPVPGRAPIYLQEAWRFPYDYGSQFVMQLIEPGNFKAIDRIFADPPKSSEQIMHPEKYFDSPRDEPRAVALPPLTDTLGAGWTFKTTDTLGEFDLSVMLRENFMEVPEGAAGWGGARYDLYQNGSESLVVMDSVWDTKKDADEFSSALESSFKLFQKKGTLWNDSRRAFGVKRNGDKVSFISGTNRATVEKVMGALP